MGMLQSMDNNSRFICNRFNTPTKEQTTVINEETENNSDNHETTKSSAASYNIQPYERMLTLGKWD